MSAAEAETLPEISQVGYRVGFGALVEQAALAIVGVGEPDAAAIAAAEHAVELALHPHELQGMFGVDIAILCSRIELSVDDAIEMLVSRGMLPDGIGAEAP
jgi:hypothetical protein